MLLLSDLLLEFLADAVPGAEEAQKTINQTGAGDEDLLTCQCNSEVSPE
jgi:hypothetical protein